MPPNFGKVHQHAPPQLPETQFFGEKPLEFPAALIKDVLPQTGVAAIIGQSGTGKTFQALHLTTCLIPDCGRDFFIDRYRIKRKGGVLYFVLEGRRAFPMRAAAAFNAALGKQMELGDRFRQPFGWNFYQPNLYANGPDALIKLVERDAARMKQEYSVDLVAVFIDTLGLSALFDNENDAAQVQFVLSGFNRLSEVTGALVIPVDHMGKDPDLGARGSSAKRDLPETVLACLGDRTENGMLTNLRMAFHKIRDGEAGRIIPYRLNQVHMGIDPDGDPVTTCVVEWEPNRPPPPKAQRAKPKTQDALHKAISDVGGLPADPVKLRKAFYAHHQGKRHTANAAWNRALREAKLVPTGDGRLDYPPGSP